MSDVDEYSRIRSRVLDAGFDLWSEGKAKVSLKAAAIRSGVGRSAAYHAFDLAGAGPEIEFQELLAATVMGRCPPDLNDL